MIGLAGPPAPPNSGAEAGLPSWEYLISAPNSLRRQAFDGAVPPGNEPGHHDSWGIGWFDGDARVSLLRQTGSASDSASFVFAAEVASRAAAGSGPAQILIGHLRKASCGAVTSENAHPVRIDPKRRSDTGDSVLIAHNGTLKESLLQSVRADVAETGRGEASSDSDTVVLAAWLADRAGNDSGSRLECLGIALDELLERARLIEAGGVAAYTGLNLLIAYPEGLYALRQYAKNPDYYTLSTRRTNNDRAWIVASEPTDSEAGWESLTPGLLTFFPRRRRRNFRAKDRVWYRDPF